MSDSSSELPHEGISRFLPPVNLGLFIVATLSLVWACLVVVGIYDTTIDETPTGWRDFLFDVCFYGFLAVAAFTIRSGIPLLNGTTCVLFGSWLLYVAAMALLPGTNTLGNVIIIAIICVVPQIVNLFDSTMENRSFRNTATRTVIWLSPLLLAIILATTLVATGIVAR